MNRITPQALYELLPAIIRIRDAEEGEPLRALTAILAREGAVVEESIAQLLDDQFIETCAPWAIPYLGALIGYRPLHQIDALAFSARADAANTIARRRRKGTAAVLEQLARDVTGWPARAVEYFQTTACVQHVNVLRPGHVLALDLHDPLRLEALGSAFETVSRTADMRAITRAPGRLGLGGRHNFPNVGIHLWRLAAQRHSDVPATRIDDRRFVFDPLGAPRQLFTRPEAEETITSLATPLNVPAPISRRALDAHLTAYYGRDTDGALKSFEITLDGTPIPPTRIVACDLSDDGAGWNHSPHVAISSTDLAVIEGGAPLIPPANALVRVDPVLGRIAFPDAEPGTVRTSFHLGFPGEIGGGEYNRAAALALPTAERPLVRFPDAAFATLQDALDALPPAGGIVEIVSNDTVAETPSITLAASAAVELRAADGVRPVLRLAGAFDLTGGADARFTLDGLVIAGGALRILPDGTESPGAVTLRHVTLVPGHALDAAGQPASPGATSLEVTATGVEITLDRCITGPLRLADTTNATIRDGIVDAAAAEPIDSAEGLAIAGLTDEAAASLTILATTVIGRIRARALPLVSDSILFARAPAGEAPVRSLRRQDGCLRFSFVPRGSVTPRRYRCQPQLAIDKAIVAREEELGTELTPAQKEQVAGRVARWLVPSFSALRYGAPALAQLSHAAPAAIRTGASDEGEMGAWHQLFQPQRETNLAIRLEEYLRFGLEAGAFYET
jgi:hypothetical protein